MPYFLAVHSLITILITKRSAALGRVRSLIRFLQKKKKKTTKRKGQYCCLKTPVTYPNPKMNMQLLCNSRGVLQTPPYLSLHLLCEFEQFGLQIFFFSLFCLSSDNCEKLNVEEDNQKLSDSQSGSDYLLN